MLLKRKYLFGTTVLAGVIAAAAPALAQETQVPGVDVQGQTQVDEIVVTGSRIRRDPTNAPTPLIQVSRQELMETGLTTVVDYLATIPALSNSLVPSDTTGVLNATGLSFANLRSLGTGRTLTLVDGRRHIGSQGGSLEVDVDAIPRLLIENIEIITGGASSVYGADAVAGVVNYVLRKDYEGLEIDANYGQLSSVTNKATMRLSALIGGNFMDDRVNAYLFGEYEDIDEIEGEDVAWLRDGRGLIGTDADPTSTAIGPNTDGIYDQDLFYNLRYVGRPRWGVTILANSQQPSALNDPDVPLASCAIGTGTSINTSANCYAIDPSRTFWYENGQARLINMGTRVGATGGNRPFNIGGDGVNQNTSFSGFSRTPSSQSSRFQTGLNFKVTPDITAYVEAKYITEDSAIASQPTFFDAYIADNTVNPITGGAASATTVQGVSGNSYFTRLDNAYLPAIIRNAMLTNFVQNYTNPTNTLPGQPNAATSGVRAWARHTAFGPDREQFNTREVTRFVAGLSGGVDELAFVHNFAWDLSYVWGELQNSNNETGFDKLRFSHALDAVVDTAGIVNGRPGEIVCRVRLIGALGLPIQNFNPFDTRATYAATDPEVAQCVPINMFGDGNQSEAALEFISADITVLETNEQEDAVAAVSGQLWDFFGAGAMGLAFGAEYRREYTEAVGRDRDTAGRFLQLNTGADFPGAEYESEELFAEMSLPFIRDSWLGEYAELSASYRQFDYTTAGEGDVYGVNLIYRPIQDITFKSSFNTSFRAPNLSENFRPRTQTFANGFSDPCDTRVITGTGVTADQRANRIANCTALASARGLTFDFAGTTASTLDDFRPTYSSGIAGVSGGNPTLKPEESESFTFSTVLEPRFFPNLAIILDYYEIEITDVIATVSAQVLANQCVDGPTLNPLACGVIFRNNPATGDGVFDQFKVGAPTSDPIGGFIIGSFNYAKRETRGLDFTVRYSLDTEEVWGKNWGTFNWNVGGLWLIDQQNFNDAINPSAFTESSTSLFFPRVRFTSRLAWAPTDDLTITWTADWQTSQDINKYRDIVNTGNIDGIPPQGYETGNFARHDLSMRYHINDELTLRAGVTNLFDASQAPYLGSTLYSNFDPYGRRFNIGLNYRAW